MAALSVLAIAVSSGKAGYVFIAGGMLQDWGIAIKATSSSAELVGFAQSLINDLRPDVIVTEDCSVDSCRKGHKARSLINTLAQLASHNSVLDVSVARPRRHASKYEEAQALAVKHPEVAGYLPAKKRRIFDFEPRAMVLFEALALAEDVMLGPPIRLAAAMGLEAQLTVLNRPAQGGFYCYPCLSLPDHLGITWSNMLGRCGSNGSSLCNPHECRGRAKHTFSLTASRGHQTASFWPSKSRSVGASSTTPHT